MKKHDIRKKAIVVAVAGAMMIPCAAFAASPQGSGSAGGTASAGSAVSAQSAAAALAAGTAAAAEESQEDSVIDGGWEITQGSFSLKKHKDAVRALQKASADLLGYSYKPLAYIGSQTVAGTNYCLLCRDEAVVPGAAPVMELVYVYKDLEGNAEIIGTQELTKGIKVNKGKIALSRNKSANRAFRKAFRSMIGCDYTPIAYLGKKAHKGTDYIALYRVTAAVPDAEPEIDIVTVHKNKKGNVRIASMKTVEIGAEESEAE